MKNYSRPGGFGRLPAAVLLLTLLLLAAFLLPKEKRFHAPTQEYENDVIKKSNLLFSKPSGFYEDPFTLEISAPTSEIYYTLDGTEPVRGREGTFRYEEKKKIEITDATPRENVHSLRTDVTTGFDEKMVEELSKGERLMHYRVPEDPVDKCTILRAAYYTPDGRRSGIETGVWFVGYGERPGYGNLQEGSGIRTVSIVTDPANLFDYEKGIYVTGKTFDDFAAADSFHDGSIWYRHVWWWWDANYHNKGRDWERPADIQFFDADGTLLLQQQAGIRIQGGGSRGFLPKSLNLYARTEYGGNTTFHYDFFGTGYEAKRMTLTSSGDDYYTRSKDRLVSELAAGMDFSTMHYEPCLLFLDGEFWGFYFLTEKYDEKYFSYYYGVPEDDVIEIKNNEIEVGTEDDLDLYEEMKSFIENNDMSTPENYEKACSLMDMDSYINYCAALIYCARCGDWPGGNFALWRARSGEAGKDVGTGTSVRDPDASGQVSDSVGQDYDTIGQGSDVSGQNPDSVDADYDSRSEAQEKTDPAAGDYRDGRWRWILFDVNSAAISPDLVDHDTMKSVLNTKNMQMFKSLWANPGFREQFSARILEYGRTIFSPACINEKLDAYSLQLKEPIELHYRRFFGNDSGLDYEEILRDEIRTFFEKRYPVVEKLMEEYGG